MKHPKRIAALVITMAACAITLLGIGVAAALSSAYGNSDIDVSTTAMSLDGDGGATVSAVVDTYWNAVDEKGYPCFDASDNRIWTQDASEYRDTCAASTTARLIRDGVDAVQLTFDGQVDSDWQNDSIGGDTFSWRETSPWHIEATGLPKEDSNGSAYSYLIVQNGIDGFVSEVSERGVNDDGSLFTRFRNCKGSDSSSIIPVSACWKDGGDVDSRKSIKVGLYAARDIWSSNGSQKLYYKDNLIVSVELNVENSWYTEVSVPVSGFSVSNSDFYILEESTYVDDGAYKVVSRDKLGEDNIDGHTYDSLLRYWHESDTDSRMISANPDDGSAYKVTYDINKAIGSFQVTNQRVGSVEVSVEQKWLDEGADPDKRPANALSLVAANIDNEFVYSASGEIYSRVFGLSDSQLYTKDTSGKLASLVVNKDATINNSEHSLTFNIGRIGNSSSFSIFNLPKYDASGTEINWEVREAWSGEHGDYGIVGDDSNSDMFSPVPSCEPKSWHHGDKLTFSFTNKRVGTKTVTFHAKWFDHYVQDELNKRPDVNLDLYRLAYEYADGYNVSGNSKLEAVKLDANGVRYAWSSSSREDRIANDTDGDFTQYLMVEGLPKYDDHGKLCVYYMRADVDTSSDTQNTIDYSYKVSVSKDSYNTDPGSWRDSIDEAGVLGQEALTDDSAVAYREDSTFNFNIEGAAKIVGDLQWADIPAGYSSNDLPDASVYLQRRMAMGSYGSDGMWTQTETPWSRLDVVRDESSKGYSVASSADNDVVDGMTVVAWTNDFAKNGSSWHYAIDMLGDNAQAGSSGVAAKLDAFDSEGRRYEYRVREVIDGLIDSAAFDQSKFATSSFDGELEEAFAKLYGIAYDGTTVINSYRSSDSTLTVDELFEGGDVYPDTTFKLYRFCQDGTSKNELEFVAEANLANYNDDAKSVAFAGLDTYTLTGEKWRYVAIEVVPDNFNVSSALGTAQGASADYKSSTVWANINGISLPAGEVGNLSMGPVVEFGNPDAATTVTFKNMFDAGVATLKGSIEWLDRDGAFGTRPDSSTPLFRLMRVNQDGSRSGEVMLQSEDADAANYLVWTARPTGGTNIWTYEIHNVEKLAPDFNPWKYTLAEDLSNTQYKLASGSSSSASCIADAGLFAPVVNELKGQVGFAASWSGDSEVRWVQRPAQHVALQARKAESGGDWADAASFFKSCGISLVDSNEFERFVDDQGGASRSVSSAWLQLPLSMRAPGAAAVEVEYRVIASRYVYDRGGLDVEVNLACTEDGSYSVEDSASFSTYMPAKQIAQKANDGVWKYDIANEYQGGVTAAEAAYSWDDNDNAFDTRPTGDVTFALQRSSNGGTTWQWVGGDGAYLAEPFDNDGLNTQLLVERVSGSNSEVSVELLPLMDVSSNGEMVTYQYRLAVVVSGSYEVAGSTVAAVSSDRVLRLEAVDAVDGSQKFVNKLLTAEIAGAAAWDDYGSGLASSLDPSAINAKIVVSRNVVASSSADAPEQLDVAPLWSKSVDGAWLYSLEGLPKLDKEGRAYSYAIAGCDSKIPGWHYAGSNADGSIAFEASRVTFDAIASGASLNGVAGFGSKLNGVSFELSNVADKVATWSRADDGAVAVAVEDDFCTSGVGASAGWIIGLPAGEYAVHEVTVPSGYQVMTDFSVIVGIDGSVKLSGASDGVSVAEDGFTIVVEGTKIPSPPVAPPSSDGGDNTGGSEGGSDKPGTDDKPDNSGGSEDDKPSKPDEKPPFASEPTLDWSGRVDDNGVVTPTLNMTFTSDDGKEQVTLNSDSGQIDIELVDVDSGTCKVTIKPEYLPAGYKGELSEGVLVNLFEGQLVALEEVQKATSSKSGYALYRDDDGTVYKVAIPKDSIKVSSPKKTIKASTLKKGKKKFKIEVTDARGKVTYKSSSKKWVKVSKKGVVTVKKGTKKGTYTITITSQATSTYAKAVKHVKFKVK